MKRVLVTGAAGFIGSALLRHLLDDPYLTIVGLDLLTYAGTLDNLPVLSPRFLFVKGDVADAGFVRGLFVEFGFDTVINLAAESHVDRSLHDPGAFVRTNVAGTQALLDACRRAWAVPEVPGESPRRFHQVSTDEVYGSLGPDDAAFTEASPYDPSSPYSASKAAADHLVRAYHRTFGLPVSITCSSNNFGPRQYPEKLLPIAILAAREAKPIPVYGDGLQCRDWLHVDDHCRGILDVIRRGREGHTYNLGSGQSPTNLQVLREICRVMDAADPKGAPHDRLLTFVKDRPGHDRRYAVDAGKARRELGWAPQAPAEALRDTVIWYLSNLDWVERIRARGGYGEWVRKNYEARAHA